MKLFAVTAATVLAGAASAQLVITGPGSYTQNFDTLASAGTGIGWTDNLPAVSMPGWYSNSTLYDADDGNAMLQGQYSYGAVGSGERALGSISLMGAILRYGVRLNNGSSNTFGSLAVSYVGEQWRSGASITDVLLFEYSTNASSLFSGTWTSVGSLDFNSPTNSGAFALNGNLAANQAALSGTMTSLNWTSGSDMWLRWTHIGNASRHGMAIDDVHLQAAPVPEPFTATALGFACLGLAGSRRKKRLSA